MQEHTETSFQNWVSLTLNSKYKDACPAAFAPIKGWHALPGDAGHRRYFRAELDHTSWIAVLYPHHHENDIARFCQLAEYFREHGIHTPAVIAQAPQDGYLLLEDLGDIHFQDCLTAENADSHYASCIMNLIGLQMCQANELFPEYSRDRLHMELSLFREWFVEKMLGHTLSKNEEMLLCSTYELLLDSALEQPQVVVHRDYHSRNLIFREGEAPGIIDFQDALFGPVTYDIVSLLRDCYIAWPGERVKRWALTYKNLADEAQLLPSVTDSQFLHWFDLMGMQRHLKVLGIFSRLSLRDGKHRYLNDLPRVIRYVREVAAKDAALSEFVKWFDAIITPLTEQQTWMRNAL